MRLLHTSDWHLGKSLETVPLAEHQRDFLVWLADLARDRQVDAILVSGDVHDRAVPSIDAVRLLQTAMIDLVRICPVIFISGNHDSPTRLGFGGPLLEAVGVHLRSSVDDLDRPVDLTGADGVPVLVYGVPYLEPEVVRLALAAEKTHESVLTAAMDRVRADLAARREAAPAHAIPRAVVLSHAFVTGGSPSDSERDVSVGGVADAPASVYAGVDYVALGHLHGPQEIANPGGPIVRYSGSPLAYSFSEQTHIKSVTLVDIDAAGNVDVEVVPVPVPRPLAKLTGDLDTLLADPAYAEVEGHWVWADLTDVRRPEDAMERVRTRFPHAIKLTWVARVDGVPLAEGGARVDPSTLAPVDVVLSFVEYVTGAPPTADDLELATASVEHVGRTELVE